MKSLGRPANLVVSLALVLSAVGCSGDTAEVEQIVRDYAAAVKKDDRAALKALLTPEMYESYENAVELRRLSGRLAGATPSPEKLQIVSLSVDRIEADTAYVSTEIRYGGQSRFERVVLKRLEARWRIAGKQQ